MLFRRQTHDIPDKAKYDPSKFIIDPANPTPVVQKLRGVEIKTEALREAHDQYLISRSQRVPFQYKPPNPLLQLTQRELSNLATSMKSTLDTCIALAEETEFLQDRKIDRQLEGDDVDPRLEYDDYVVNYDIQDADLDEVFDAPLVHDR